MQNMKQFAKERLGDLERLTYAYVSNTQTDYVYGVDNNNLNQIMLETRGPEHAATVLAAARSGGYEISELTR